MSDLVVGVLTFSSLQNDLEGGVLNFPGMRGAYMQACASHSKSEVKGTAVKLCVCMKSQIARQIRLVGNNSAITVVSSVLVKLLACTRTNISV